MTELDKEILFSKCETLGAGETVSCSEHPSYTVHRYPDVWWALWDVPVKGHLGVQLHNPDELRRFIFKRAGQFKKIEEPKL